MMEGQIYEDERIVIALSNTSKGSTAFRVLPKDNPENWVTIFYEKGGLGIFILRASDERQKIEIDRNCMGEEVALISDKKS